MNSVDKWQNSQEEVYAKEQEMQQQLWEELHEREVLQQTAQKTRQTIDIQICDIIRKGNIRSDNKNILELATSIKERGLLQPPLLYASEDHFYLIAGFRRVEALEALYGAEHVVNCQYIEDIEESERIALMLVENEQREEIDAMSSAKALKDLMRSSSNNTASSLARSLGLSPRWVQDRLRLLDLPEKIQQRVKQGDLSFTIADTLRRKVNEGEIEQEEAVNLSEKISSGEIAPSQIEEVIREEPEERVAMSANLEYIEEEIEVEETEISPEEALLQKQEKLEKMADSILEQSIDAEEIEEKVSPHKVTEESRVVAGECIALAHALSLYPDFAFKHNIKEPWLEVPLLSSRVRKELFEDLQRSVWVGLSDEFKSHFVFKD